MPKVRASSATIGTTRGPSFSSLRSCDSSCTNTIVVDWLRSDALSDGTASVSALVVLDGR